jgi:hypothetical protein
MFIELNVTCDPVGNQTAFCVVFSINKSSLRNVYNRYFLIEVYVLSEVLNDPTHDRSHPHSNYYYSLRKTEEKGGRILLNAKPTKMGPNRCLLPFTNQTQIYEKKSTHLISIPVPKNTLACY